MKTKVGQKNEFNKCSCCSKTPKRAKQVHTLALVRTHEESFVQLQAKTTKQDQRKLTNRAKRKYLSTALSLSLVDVVKEYQNRSNDLEQFNENQAFKRSYWNMYHCSRKLETSNGKLIGKYCKNRLCVVCSAIRTANLMKKYLPVIESWLDEDKVYFLTFTVPNCKAEHLKDTIRSMQDIIKKIQQSLKKRYQRAKKPPIQGLRKLECTYNSLRKDFHPHYHLLIKGKAAAEAFMEQWMNRTEHLKTSSKAQDISEANMGAGKELFKYFTKVITTEKSSNGTNKRLIYAEAVHTIFKAIKGVRTFQNFGFKLPKEDKTEEQLSFELEVPQVENLEEQTYIWMQGNANWFCTDTGENLSQHELSDNLKEIVSNIVRVKKLNPK